MDIRLNQKGCGFSQHKMHVNQKRLGMRHIASLAIHMWHIAAADFFNLLQPHHMW